MGLRRRILESLFGLKKDSLKTSTKVIVNDVKQSYGETPSISFQTLQNYLYKDSLLYTAVSHMVSETSRPIEVTANPEYKVTIEGKTVIDYINEYCRKQNIDGKIALWAMELIAYGNSFVRIKSDGTLESIPLIGIERFVGVDNTTSITEKYDLQLNAYYKMIKIPYEEFIHFRTMYSSNSPLGVGIIQPLLETTNIDSPSLMQMREQLRIAMTNLALKLGAPTEYVSGELTDNDTEVIGNALNQAPYHGKRIVLNKKVDIKTSMMPRSGILDAWQELIEDETFVALADPLLRLASKTGFTEASSKVAQEMHQKRIEFYQRIIKRGLEQLFNKILEQSAYDVEKAGIKVEFINQTEIVPEANVEVK